jgi:hypothetical protein
LLSIQSDKLQDDLVGFCFNIIELSLYQQSSLQDALLLIPLLLPCPRDGTDDVLALIARHCSAKEVVMAAQEAAERLRSDPSEGDSDDESEDVPLATQLTRLLSLLAKGEYVWLQFRGSTIFSTFSLPSSCAPKVTLADACTISRTRAAPDPRGESRDGDGGPIARTECGANDPGTGGVGHGESGR